MTLEDIDKYGPAVVALGNINDEAFARGALEKLVETADLGEDGPGFIKSLTETPEGVKYLASTLGKKSQDALMSADIRELFGFYNSDFKEYFDDASYAVAKGVFADYAGQTYESVYNQFTDAQAIISNKNRKLSEDEEKKYLGIMEKYGKIVVPIQGFEKFKKAEISEPLDKKSFRENMAEMFKPKKKSE